MFRTDGCKGRLEAATISDILYLFSKENLGKSQGILNNDVCNNALGLVSPTLLTGAKVSNKIWLQKKRGINVRPSDPNLLNLGVVLVPFDAQWRLYTSYPSYFQLAFNTIFIWFGINVFTSASITFGLRRIRLIFRDSFIQILLKKSFDISK